MIPSRMAWRDVRLKYVVREIDDRVQMEDASLPLLSVSIHRGVLPRTSMTDRESRAENFIGYKLVRDGDIVINRMRAFQGGAGVSPMAGIVSADYAVLRPSDSLDARYLHHLIRSRWFVSEMTARLRGIGNSELGAVRTPRVNVEDLGQIVVSLPPVSAQHLLATYLDGATARTMALLQEHRRLRDLALEREAMILRDLVMKQQAAPRPLALMAEFINGYPFKPDDFTQSGLPVIRISQLTDPDADCDLFDGPVPDLVRLHGGDLVFSWSASLQVEIWTRGEAILNQHLFRVVPHRGVDRGWLRWALHVARDDFRELMHGSTMTHITRPMMSEVRVPLPDLAAQQRIAELADQLHARTDGLVHEVETGIRLLETRLASLIDAAIMGRISVDGAAS